VSAPSAGGEVNRGANCGPISGLTRRTPSAVGTSVTSAGNSSDVPADGPSTCGMSTRSGGRTFVRTAPTRPTRHPASSNVIWWDIPTSGHTAAPSASNASELPASSRFTY